MAVHQLVVVIILGLAVAAVATEGHPLLQAHQLREQVVVVVVHILSLAALGVLVVLGVVLRVVMETVVMVV